MERGVERRQRGGDEGEKERERKRDTRGGVQRKRVEKKGDGPRAMVQEEARDGARQKKRAVRKRKRRA